MIARLSFVAGALALGHALQIANGFYDGAALTWLTAALALCLAGTLATGRGRADDTSLTLRVAMALGIGWQLVSLATAPPAMYLERGTSLTAFRAGIGVEAVLVAAGIAGFAAARPFWFPALMAVHAALGVWTLTSSPNPHIDVVVVHRAAFDALLGGGNPYAITFQNIYGENTGFYNADAVAGGRVMFGYPYPPVSLLLALPGHLLAGDYRYAQLAAWLAAGVLIGYSGYGLTSKLAAVLALTTPRGFFVLEQGWTEPISLMLLAATVYLLARGTWTSALAGGVLIVSKQYLAFAAPLLWLTAPATLGRSRWLAVGAAAAAAVTLPFLLWDPRMFVEQVVLIQTREPFRVDALSYLSWAARTGLGAGSMLWALAAGLVGLGVALAVTPRTAEGFAGGVALTSFLAFAFGSKAFCNYYFLVVGAMCCALAAASRPPDQLDGRSAGRA